MPQEHHVRQRHKEDLLDERMAERVDRLLDEIGAIVERHDRHAGWQPWLNLRDPRFHGVDHTLRVHAGSRHHDTADRLVFSFDQ